MGYSGPKASNIFQNPGVANNKGIVEPKLPGVGSPGKYKTVAKEIHSEKQKQALIAGAKKSGNKGFANKIASQTVAKKRNCSY
jgi:hypothetical protein